MCVQTLSPEFWDVLAEQKRGVLQAKGWGLTSPWPLHQGVCQFELEACQAVLRCIYQERIGGGGAL